MLEAALFSNHPAHSGTPKVCIRQKGVSGSGPGTAPPGIWEAAVPGAAAAARESALGCSPRSSALRSTVSLSSRWRLELRASPSMLAPALDVSLILAWQSLCSGQALQLISQTIQGRH